MTSTRVLSAPNQTNKTSPVIVPQPSLDLDDPRVAHLGPLPKPTRLPTQEGVRDSDDWEPYHLKDWEPYHSEAFEEWKTYPPSPTQQNKSSAPRCPPSHRSCHETSF
ncbi:unnamed protein product [Prunus brigantina]